MRKGKTTLIWISLVLLVSVLATTGMAQQAGKPAAGRMQNILENLGLRPILAGLKLTEAQRADIRTIIQGHQKDILQARRALLQARLALAQEDPNAPNEFGRVQAQTMALRLEILGQIKQKLTAEQLTILQERQQKQIQRLERQLKGPGQN